MAQPLTCVLTSQLFTLTCLVVLLVLVPCYVRSETTTGSVEGEGDKEKSGVQFTATTQTIVADQTETLSLKCALGEGTKIDGNISAIQVKQGKKVIASVTPQEDAKALTDDDQLTVEGSLEELGNGFRFLSLTWSEPDQAQAGKYKCEVVFQNLQGKEKKLSKVIGIRYNKPSTQDLIASVKQLLQDEISGLRSDVDKLNGEVNKKVNDIVTSVNELKQNTDSAIQALSARVQGVKIDVGTLRGEVNSKDREIVATISELKQQTYAGLQGVKNDVARLTGEVNKKDSEIISAINVLKQQTAVAIRARVPLIQQGNKACGGYFNIYFRQRYNRPPTVFVSYRILDFNARTNLRANLYVVAVYTTHFRAYCNKWHDTIMYGPTQFQWMSIEQ